MPSCRRMDSCMRSSQDFCSRLFLASRAPTPPRVSLQYCLAAALIVSAAASEFHAFALGTAAFVAAHVTLVSLVALRFLRRQQNPPSTFVLIGLGLLGGLLGALLSCGVAWELVPAAWDMLGKRLLTEGMVMLLVLGVGGFLGPRLLGFAELPTFAVPGARMRGGRPRVRSVASMFCGRRPGRPFCSRSWPSTDLDWNGWPFSARPLSRA